MRSKQPHRLTASRLILLTGLAVFPWRPAFADSATEQQLRAALQQATTQIAQLQDQVANLQAQEAPDQAQIAALQAQLQTMKQQGGQAQGAESKAASAATDKQVAELNQRLAAQQAALGKASAAYSQAANIANTNAAANHQLTTQLTALKTRESNCEAENAELYKTGNTILDQLAHRGALWSSFSSVEPFVGIERVKLQNIVQDDQNKLDDNQLLPPNGNSQ
jgi:chromosome segregation ATPase